MTHSTVRLMHYDPRWRQEFQQTRSSVLQSCLGWVSSVEHIGSTAISGLIAQPTIDLLAGVRSSDGSDSEAIAQATLLIEGLNYRRDEPHDWAPEAVVLNKPRHGEPTHRIFLMEIGSSAWKNALMIRDGLRKDPELAIRFEETKIARWRISQGDPVRYERDKSAFLTHLHDQLQVRNNKPDG